MAAFVQPNYFRNGIYASKAYFNTEAPDAKLRLGSAGILKTSSLTAPSLWDWHVPIASWSKDEFIYLNGVFNLTYTGTNYTHNYLLSVSLDPGLRLNVTVLNNHLVGAQGRMNVNYMSVFKSADGNRFYLTMYCSTGNLDTSKLTSTFYGQSLNKSIDFTVTRPVAGAGPVTVIRTIQNLDDNFKTNAPQANVSLNNFKQNSSIVCNPADADSRPAGTDGFGTCICFGGTNGTQFGQLFVARADSQIYYRGTDSNGNFGAWKSFSNAGSAPTNNPIFTGTVSIGGTNSYLTNPGGQAWNLRMQADSLYLTSKYGTYMTKNAYFDGTTWRKMDTAQNSAIFVIEQGAAAGLPVAKFYVGKQGEDAPTTSSYVMFHTGNMGAGSGLDADTLDGLDSSSFSKNLGTSAAAINFDSFTTTGIYHVDSNDGATNSTNAPTFDLRYNKTYSGGSRAAGVLEVLAGFGPTFVYQRYTTYAATGGAGGSIPQVAVRSRYNNVWSNWSFLTDNSAVLNLNARSQEYTVPGTQDGTYMWVRLGFNGFNTTKFGPGKIKITRDITADGGKPYIGCTMEVVFASHEGHTGSINGTVFYNQHGPRTEAKGSGGMLIDKIWISDDNANAVGVYLNMPKGVTFKFEWDYATEQLRASYVSSAAGYNNNGGLHIYTPGTPGVDGVYLGQGLNYIDCTTNLSLSPYGHNGFYYNGNRIGMPTISSAAPSGGMVNDVWYQV